MGVSLEVYRCRIGCFQPRSNCRSSNGRERRKSTSTFMKHLPLVVLGLLLLIAGIEPNPGPSQPQPRSRGHACQYCNQRFESALVLCRHLKVHKSVRKFSVQCTFPDCESFLSSPESFRSHINIYHAPKKSPTPALQKSKCPVPSCTESFSVRKDYLLHMVRAHLKKNEAFECLYDHCSTQLRFISQFRVHMARYHPRPKPSMPEISQPNVFVDDGFEADESDDFPEEDFSVPYDAPDDEDLYPDSIIKKEVAQFYLKLESTDLLPTTCVQSISEEIAILTDLIHHQLKRSLKKELEAIQLDHVTIQSVINKTFHRDTIYNIHHKYEDFDFMGTNHMRMKFWTNNYPFVEPVPVSLCSDDSKKRFAHHIPIKKTLSVMLRDQEIKKLVLKSFETPVNANTEVLSDFTDGSMFESHIRCQHNGSRKCLQLIIFQDGLEFNGLAPSSGTYKPNPFYYSLGNLPPQYRTNLDLIQLCYMILDKDLKPTQEQELKDFDKLKAAMEPLLHELADLKVKGIEFNGEIVPVCLLFMVGDSLGQHVFGGFVKNFNAEFWCRYCPISKTVFKDTPYHLEDYRTAEEYDEYVKIAKKKWVHDKKKGLEAKKKSNLHAVKKPGKVTKKVTAASKTSINQVISKSAYQKLIAVSYKGVKYRPSPFNSPVLGFHVISSQPPCIAHDLFEGAVKKILAEILKYFITEKEWFDLTVLNKRIKDFKCKGNDRLDSPTPLKKLDSLSGSACENWTLLRLLPFMIEDLIEDFKDPYWQLYLQLKEICEYVCAPEITKTQVNYLQSVINYFLEVVKELLPHCLIPKLHFLCHYPGLILLFGPLIRLFTLRYESKHMFFKQVARACRNYINLTYTLSRKYMCRFAYDHSSKIIPPKVKFNSSSVVSSEVASLLGDEYNLADFEEIKTVTIHGILYAHKQFLIIGCDDSCDMSVGFIHRILVQPKCNKVFFLVDKRKSTNSGNGYYIVEKSSSLFQLMSLDKFSDYYPLESYLIRGQDCLSLKRTNIAMCQ